MLSLADSRTLFLIAEYLQDEEVVALLLVASPQQTCRAVKSKLMSIARIEIRLLKTRSKVAEDCLRFASCQQPAMPAPVDFGCWWLPAMGMQLRASRLLPATGLLRIARLRKASKRLKSLDRRLAKIEDAAPVEVRPCHQVKDYYKDLGQLVAPARRLPGLPGPQPEEGQRAAGELRVEHMAGYSLCPMKYLRLAGGKVQALKLRIAH